MKLWAGLFSLVAFLHIGAAHAATDCSKIPYLDCRGDKTFPNPYTCITSQLGPVKITPVFITASAYGMCNAANWLLYHSCAYGQKNLNTPRMRHWTVPRVAPGINRPGTQVFCKPYDQPFF